MVNKLSTSQKIDLSRRLVRSLLADRFNLKTEIITKELPVYALVLAKGGPKLRQVEAVEYPPPGVKPEPGANYRSLGITGPNQMTATAWSMQGLADWLSSQSEIGNRLVINKTGLKGDFNYVLNGIHIDGTTQSDAATISIFTALQEQLGLKLESQKAPVPVLIIDHVERPTEN